MTTQPNYKTASIICPVCGTGLRSSKDQKSLSCDNNHNFDRAKQGYVNLLLNTQKSSSQPGDSQQMVEARSAFLSLGHYETITHTINQVVSQQLETMFRSKAGTPSGFKNDTFQYTDIACGEGYYTQAISQPLNQALGAKNLSLNAKGLDISTPAIKAASKRNKDINWYVGNAFHLPISNGTQDLCTHMFARLSAEETARVLKPGGLFIEVQAGPTHLAALKEELYETPSKKSDKEASAEPALSKYFERTEVKNLSFSFALVNSDQISNLIDMTPHLWRAPKDRIEKTRGLNHLELEANVQVSIYKRKAIKFAPTELDQAKS